MPNTDLSQYKGLYISTANEYIQKLADGMHVLAENTMDSSATEQIYIAAHSLGSQSLVMGYKESGLLARVIEKIFYNVRNNTIQVTPSLVVSLEDAVSKLKIRLQAIEDNTKEIDLLATIKQLEKLSGVHVQDPEKQK